MSAKEKLTEQQMCERCQLYANRLRAIDKTNGQAKAALKAMIATWDSYLSNPLGYPAYQQAKKVLAAMEAPQ